MIRSTTKFWLAVDVVLFHRFLDGDPKTGGFQGPKKLQLPSIYTPPLTIDWIHRANIPPTGDTFMII